jgi:Uma2 family endonuclease
MKSSLQALDITLKKLRKTDCFHAVTVAILELSEQLIPPQCRRQLRLIALPEQRIRVAMNRYRVPDVCTEPPLLCVEILSPDDSFPRLQHPLDDYLAMGVPNIWVIDPASHRGWSITREGHFEALDGILRTADNQFALPLADLFPPDHG